MWINSCEINNINSHGYIIGEKTSKMFWALGSKFLIIIFGS